MTNSFQGPRPRPSAQPHPGRRVIACFLAAAIFLVDPGIGEPIRRLRAQQQVIDSEAGIALPRARLIIPEGPHPAARMPRPERIGARKSVVRERMCQYVST